jgi:hypothetical protein
MAAQPDASTRRGPAPTQPIVGGDPTVTDAPPDISIHHLRVVTNASTVELPGRVVEVLRGGLDEYIIPNGIEKGAIQLDRVSGINPEF